MLSPRLTRIIVVTVAVVWVANFVLTAVLPGYETQQEINGIFLGTVGLVLGVSRGRSGSNDD